MSQTFVGNGRKALVAGILQCYENMTNVFGESKSCWISLESPSGWGKTRVAQEVYRELAARQKTAYWPPDIVSTFNVKPFDIAGRRKRVHPSVLEFDREPGALPEFFWWGIGCDMRSSNDVSHTLFEDLYQVKAHSPYLELSWSAATAFGMGRYTSLNAAKQAVRAVFQETRNEGIAAAAKELLGATVPGLGLARRLIRLGFEDAKKSLKMQSDIKDGGKLDSIIGIEKIDFVDEIVSLLSRLAIPSLPIIIFVEDLHRASAPVLKLLEKLLRYNAPIMIITSTWPGEFDRLDELALLENDTWVGDRIIRIRHDKSVPNRFPRADASLERMSDNDLRELVFSMYPKAENDTAERLAVRYSNPLTLELVLSLKKNVLGYPHLSIDSDEINSLPRTVRRLYEKLWDELPENSQALLSLVTLAMPEDYPSWMKPLVKKSICDLDIIDQSAELLSLSDVPHGWIRKVSKLLQTFSESDQLYVARDALDDHFGDDVQNAFMKRIAHNVLELEWIDSSNIEHRHLAQLCLKLKKVNLIDEVTFKKALLFLMDYIVAQPLLLKWGISLTNEIEKQLKDGDSLPDYQTLKILSQRAICIGKSGDLERAIKLLSKTVRLFSIVLGSNHADTLETRNALAVFICEAGRVDEAVKLLEILLLDYTRYLGSNHPGTLLTRSNIASSLLKAGRAEEAILDYEAILEDSTQIMGLDHIETLQIQNALASAYGQAGRVVEALQLLWVVYSERDRILGPDHPDSLTTRNIIAQHVAELGQLNAAVELSRSVLKDRTRILGPNDPATLRTRNNLARLVGKSGQMEEAVTLFKNLDTDYIRILGQDHPDTLLQRNNLAAFIGYTGQVKKALEAYENLLIDATNALSSEHEVTIIVRNNVIKWLTKAGRPEEALKISELLLKDLKRVLGATNKNVVTARINRAEALGEMGRISEAIDAFEVLLDDLGRDLGQTNSTTIRVCHHIMDWIKNNKK